MEIIDSLRVAPPSTEGGTWPALRGRLFAICRVPKAPSDEGAVTAFAVTGGETLGGLLFTLPRKAGGIGASRVVENEFRAAVGRPDGGIKVKPHASPFGRGARRAERALSVTAKAVPAPPKGEPRGRAYCLYLRLLSRAKAAAARTEKTATPAIISSMGRLSPVWAVIAGSAAV